MKRNHISIFFLFAFLLSFSISYSQNYTWIRTAGGTTDDYEGDIVTDNLGNTFVTGSYGNTLKIGNLSLPSSGGSDPFVAKYDIAGNLLWVKKVGGSSSDYASAIGVDKLGNCYVAGQFSFNATFGTITLNSIGSTDMFLIKYDPNGNLLWVKQAGGPNNNTKPSFMEVDKDGNCVISGNFGFSTAGKTVTFGTSTFTSGGEIDLFMVKYNADGNVTWAKNASGPKDERGAGIALDSVGNIYMAANFWGSCTFEGITYATPLTNSNMDILLAKYNSSGDLLWVKRESGAGNDVAARIASDKNGNVYLTGSFEQTATFETSSITSFGEADIFVCKYDSQGSLKWVKKAGSEYYDYGKDITLDNKGNLFIIGQYSQYSSSYQGFFDNIVLPNSGKGDVYIAQMDTLGNFIWVENVGGPNLERAGAICVDKDGYLRFQLYFQYRFVSGNAFINAVGTGDLIWGSFNPTTFVRYSNTIRGNIFSANNSGCIKDPAEKGMNNFFIKAEPGPLYGVTDPNGNYRINVDSGSYTVSQIIPDRKGQIATQTCPSIPNTYTVVLKKFNKDTSGFNFANNVIDCSLLTVDISSTRRRRCARNYTTINYCNEGATDASNVQLKVIFPQYVVPISSNSPWDQKTDSIITYNIGNLGAGQCGKIEITDSVKCITNITGFTQCTKAIISPNNQCTAVNPAWDKSSVKVTGKCMNNSYVYFTITNTGTEGMAGPEEYRVFYDNILVYKNSFQLAGGNYLIVEVPAGGQTIRLEADQRPGHPGKSRPRETIEGCGGTSAAEVSKGFVLPPPQDDAEEEVEISCMEIRDSYDPNDKQAAPTNYTTNNYIGKNDELEYQIRFQNTGTDTAYKIVIKDTLSNLLDIPSLKLGASSHAYTLDIIGENEHVLIWTFNNINLPDSNRNNLGSNGFVKFKINQLPNNPKGSIINNKAHIYFDYNDPVNTNEVFNTVWDTTITDLSQGNGINQVMGTSIVKSYNQNIKTTIHPNPFNEYTTFVIQSERLLHFPSTLIITDLDGKTVRKESIHKNTFDFYKKDLPSGIYFYQIESNQDKVASGKLIIIK